MILAGDIGGTKTLLAAFDGDRCLVRRRYDSRAFARFDDLLDEFLGAAGLSGTAFGSACFGVAGPVLDQRASLTNLPWQIDAARLAATHGLGSVSLLNDFEAAAHGVDALAPEALATLQRGAFDPDRPRVLIGAGTGLGAAYLIDGRVIAGEAGHAGFAPADSQQARLADWLRRQLGRVEVEHVLSGTGLARIGHFVLQADSSPPDRALHCALAAAEPARAVTALALEGDAAALAAVDLFLRCYGAVAGDHALVVLARGGVYLAGGIAPALLPLLAGGALVEAFNDKGRFAPITRTCPIHVVTDPDIGLLGAARFATRGGPR